MAPQVDDLNGQLLELVAKIPAIPAILKILRDETGMRFVGIARVTPQRWVTCAVLDEAGFGLVPGDELDVNTTVCKAQLDHPRTIAFDDYLLDPEYRDHPAPVLYGFRSHMSAAIFMGDGSYFGSLCVLDPEPVAVNTERTIGTVESMAALIGRLLDAAFAHGATTQALVDERAVSASREQFLAVVAHDLRNPLATMHNSSQILMRSQDPSVQRVGAFLRGSAARMTGLVDDLVDFARGRAGSAMPVRLAPRSDVNAVLQAIVEEARASHPGRDIQASIHLDGPILCDAARLQQLLSNLLGNALAYGAAGKPVAVQAYERAGAAHVAVTNWGPPIAPEALERVFAAYSRDIAQRQDSSMGLGLHICRLIATAHGGQLSVGSDLEAGTRFEMTWPSNRPCSLDPTGV